MGNEEYLRSNFSLEINEEFQSSNLSLEDE